MSSATRSRPRLGRVVATGLLGAVGAAAATTLGAALAKSAGVRFEIPSGGEVIPTAGFTSVTTAFCLAGVALAAALARWSADPARRFVQVTVPLAAASLVPPWAVGADTSTALTLTGLHLVAAGVMIPVQARALRAQP